MFQAVQLPGQRKQNYKKNCNRVAQLATGWHILQQCGTYCKRVAHVATGWRILQEGGTDCNRVAHPPAGVAHLDACLTDVDGDHLSHGDYLSLLLSNEHKSQVVLIQWKSPWPTAMSRKSCLVWECARTMWRRTGFRHSRQGVKEGAGKVGKPWGTRFSTNQPPPRMPSCLVHYCIKCYFLIALTFKLSL